MRRTCEQLVRQPKNINDRDDARCGRPAVELLVFADGQLWLCAEHFDAAEVAEARARRFVAELPLVDPKDVL